MFPFFSRMFPGTNLQDLNLDWIIRRIMELSKGIIAPWINPQNYHWMVYDTTAENFVDSGVSAAGEGTGPQGEPGKSPVIGSNGNWYVWDLTTEAYTDTGISATGPQGDPGKSPIIGSNGNWYVWDDASEAYTDTGIDATGPQGERGPGVNRNLVYNGCFIGGQLPVNQRGQDLYRTASSYCIDGWFLNGYPPDVTLSADGLTIAKQTGSSSSGFMSQVVDLPYSELAGREVTFSVLYEDEEGIKLATGTNTFPDNVPSELTYVISLGDQIPHGGTYTALRITNSGQIRVGLGQLPGFSLNFIAVKLELGDMQTLAHKEIIGGIEKWVLNELPDYGEELLKCQRYFQIFRTQALRPTYRQDYRPEMAVNPQSGATDPNQPTPGTITIDSTTYYTASAEA